MLLAIGPNKVFLIPDSTEGSNPCALELHKVFAHEVRALSAYTNVFRGMNADIIMQSCTWRARSTFSDFYLRDMCSLLDDIYVMSSSVALDDIFVMSSSLAGT